MRKQELKERLKKAQEELATAQKELREIKRKEKEELIYKKLDELKEFGYEIDISREVYSSCIGYGRSYETVTLKRSL